MSGFVYFAECAGAIKIGRAASVRRRLQALSIANVAPIMLLGSIPGGHLEKEIHARLARYRRRGEWFDDHPEIRSLLSDLLKAADSDERMLSVIRKPSKFAEPPPAPDVTALNQRWLGILDEYVAILKRFMPSACIDQEMREFVLAFIERFKPISIAWDHRTTDGEELLTAARALFDEILPNLERMEHQLKAITNARSGAAGGSHDRDDARSMRPAVTRATRI